MGVFAGSGALRWGGGSHSDPQRLSLTSHLSATAVVVSKAQEGASGFGVMKSWLRIPIPPPPTWVNLGCRPSFCETQITTPDTRHGRRAAQSWPAARARLGGPFCL